MKKYWNQIIEYFDTNKKELAESNWMLLRKMTLIYTFFLFVYYFVMCFFMESQNQMTLIFMAIILHLIYTGIVWAHKKAPKDNSVVNRYLIIFGIMILFPAMIMGTVLSRDRAAILFPLVLIMMGQIYTLSPFHVYALDLVSSIVFLVFSATYKTEYYFYQDLLSVLIADTITYVCSDTIMRHRLEANLVQNDLQQLCLEDQMTGLYNKIAFEKMYNDYQYGRGHGLYALAVIDMDGFKTVNDQYGHQLGDEVLILFSKLLKEVFSDRKNSVIGRFGGDEFIVLLRNQYDRDEIQKQFNRLITQSNQIGIEKFGFPIECSIGVSIANQLPQSFASCFITADQALYATKNEYGNRCMVVERSQVQTTKPQMLIVDDDEITRTLFRSYFDESFQLLEAANGNEALRHIEQFREHISIILMDLEMPEMDGRAVLEKIHTMQNISKIPVLIVSAHMENDLNLKDLGVAGLIQKPFRPDEIRGIVERTLLA